MLNLNYLNDTKFYQVSYKTISKNIVEIIGDFPIKTDGFILTRVGEPTAFRGDYSGYTTVYKEIEEGVQFSNNGSVWIPEIKFSTKGGGTIEGTTTQKVYNYEELIIPTPIADENYKFVGWNPEISESGVIDKDIKFVAQFEYVMPIDEYREMRQAENKTALADFLKANPLLWIDGMYYGVTQEDQNEMSLDFSTYQFKQSIGDTEWRLQWHSIKSACRDFTMEEFGALLNAIADFVYPYRQLEMQYKEAIYGATTKEEIAAIELVYALPVVEEETEIEETTDETIE